jgi:hypothetical protein
MAEVSLGSIAAGYPIEGLAAEGGMGRVYRATQMALGRQVALKVIVSELAFDEAFRARFERESHLLLSNLCSTVRGCAICVASRLWRPERDALDQGWNA